MLVKTIFSPHYTFVKLHILFYLSNHVHIVKILGAADMDEGVKLRQQNALLKVKLRNAEKKLAEAERRNKRLQVELLDQFPRGIK